MVMKGVRGSLNQGVPHAPDQGAERVKKISGSNKSSREVRGKKTVQRGRIYTEETTHAEYKNSHKKRLN